VVSLVVIAFNEEAHIARCLESAVGVVDELLVVDSHSTDRTVEIAQALGARVLIRAFTGYRSQKAWAIDQAIHDQVLLLDADEALSPALREQVRRLPNPWDADAYQMNRLSCLGDRWIRHGAWYPDRKLRLFDRRKVRMGGEDPHDRIEPNPGARVRMLGGDILHFTNGSLYSRVESVNRLSGAAAKALYDRGVRSSLLRMLIKPPMRFIKEFWWQRGFLDGYYGYFIARTSAQYVFFREMKLWAHWRNGTADRG
jgi:glycosyltransferase involved in cell wall biosynthesis